MLGNISEQTKDFGFLVLASMREDNTKHTKHIVGIEGMINTMKNRNIIRKTKTTPILLWFETRFLCPSYPGTHTIDQAGLELRDRLPL